MIRVTLLSLAIVGASAAVAPVEAMIIMGAGTVTCGEWLRLRPSLGREGNLTDLGSLYQLQAWIDGYISGYNVGSNGQPDLLASRPESAALYAWIDNYCRSDPLGHIGEAADALAQALRSRAERK